MPPMSIWPLAPMLNRPAWKPTATAKPARISGLARVSVSDSAAQLPKEPRNNAA